MSVCTDTDTYVAWQDTGSTSFLELGAGKAYLACMLAEAFPVQSLVLVDNQSFKLQTDRC